MCDFSTHPIFSLGLFWNGVFWGWSIFFLWDILMMYSRWSSLTLMFSCRHYTLRQSQTTKPPTRQPHRNSGDERDVQPTSWGKCPSEPRELSKSLRIPFFVALRVRSETDQYLQLAADQQRLPAASALLSPLFPLQCNTRSLQIVGGRRPWTVWLPARRLRSGKASERSRADERATWDREDDGRGQIEDDRLGSNERCGGRANSAAIVSAVLQGEHEQEEQQSEQHQHRHLNQRSLRKLELDFSFVQRRHRPTKLVVEMWFGEKRKSVRLLHARRRPTEVEEASQPPSQREAESGRQGAVFQS